MAVNEIPSVDLSTDSRDCEFLVQKAERLVETRHGSLFCLQSRSSQQL